MKYFPALLRPEQEASAESLNAPLRAVEEVLSAVSGDNFDDEVFTWENVPLDQTMRIAHKFSDLEDALTPDADHITCTAYDTTTLTYDGSAGNPELYTLAWAPLAIRFDELSFEKSFRSGFLHVIFSAQVSSSGNDPAAIQFAIRVDGNVIQESIWGGSASMQDPMAGYSQTEFPVMVQAMMPVFDGVHTVEVVYRNVTSWQDADERVAVYRVTSYEFICMEIGGA